MPEVKIPNNDLNEVKKKIYDCIRIVHSRFPWASLSNFIDSVDEVIEYSVEEEKQCILDTYDPTTIEESDCDLDEIPSIPVISYKTALESLKALHLFRLQNHYVNLQTGR